MFQNFNHVSPVKWLGAPTLIIYKQRVGLVK